MDRKNFLKKSACGAACFAATPFVTGKVSAQELPPRKRYKMEIEIFENEAGRTCHKVGEKFEYPKDAGEICPWLLGSMNNFISALQNGGILYWKYEGTPYEKEIDPDGITTEFVCCPDPTAKIIAKITRTVIS